MVNNVPTFVKYREAIKGANGLEVITYETFGFIKEETEHAILLEHRRGGISDKGKEFFDNSNRYEPILRSSILEIYELFPGVPVVSASNAKNLSDEAAVPTKPDKPSTHRRGKDSESPTMS